MVATLAPAAMLFKSASKRGAASKSNTLVSCAVLFLVAKFLVIAMSKGPPSALTEASAVPSTSAPSRAPMAASSKMAASP